MKHMRLDDVRRVAAIKQAQVSTMCRSERLQRWAEQLMKHPDRSLQPLSRMESLPPWQLAELREEGTPLSVAFQDNVLRDEGLTGDTVGEAKAFFDLSSGEIHYLLCDCHFQGTMTAGQVAARIGHIADRVTIRELWSRLRGAAVTAFGK